jgi:hypothetical protein
MSFQDDRDMTSGPASPAWKGEEVAIEDFDELRDSTKRSIIECNIPFRKDDGFVHPNKKDGTVSNENVIGGVRPEVTSGEPPILPRGGSSMQFQVKDSGQREVFSTGAMRDIQEGKGRFDLIPPYALERLAILYESGAKKYGEDNWRKGIPTRRCLDSLLRHANKVVKGLDDEDHLAAVIWNAFTIIETQEMIRQGKLPKELDDIGV